MLPGNRVYRQWYIAVILVSICTNSCEQGITPEPQPQIDVVLSVKPGMNLRVALVNRGQTQYTIVLPGDGSLDHMRTPCIGWSVIRRQKQEGLLGVSHPQDTPKTERLRCGSINALKQDEVVVLKPGDSCDLGEWIYSWTLQPDTTGQFEIVFYYENRPQMEWIGTPLGIHDPEAMVAVRNSTPFKGKSNVVTVEF